MCLSDIMTLFEEYIKTIEHFKGMSHPGASSYSSQSRANLVIG